MGKFVQLDCQDGNPIAAKEFPIKRDACSTPSCVLRRGAKKKRAAATDSGGEPEYTPWQVTMAAARCESFAEWEIFIWRLTQFFLSATLVPINVLKDTSTNALPAKDPNDSASAPGVTPEQGPAGGQPSADGSGESKSQFRQSNNLYRPRAARAAYRFGVANPQGGKKFY